MAFSLAVSTVIKWVGFFHFNAYPECRYAECRYAECRGAICLEVRMEKREREWSWKVQSELSGPIGGLSGGVRLNGKPYFISDVTV